MGYVPTGAYRFSPYSQRRTLLPRSEMTNPFLPVSRNQHGIGLAILSSLRPKPGPGDPRHPIRSTAISFSAPGKGFHTPRALRSPKGQFCNLFDRIGAQMACCCFSIARGSSQ